VRRIAALPRRAPYDVPARRVAEALAQKYGSIASSDLGQDSGVVAL
jgi:hypothetical protein